MTMPRGGTEVIMKPNASVKKRSLKGKLTIVIVMLCLLQLLFSAGGYIYVYGNIRQNSARKINDAFSHTLDYVNDVNNYSKDIMDVITRRVTLQQITRENYFKNYGDILRLCAILQACTADNRFSEACVYLPDVNILISSRRNIIINDDQMTSKSFKIYRYLNDRPENTFYKYNDVFGDQSGYYYARKFDSDYGHAGGVVFYLWLSDSYFDDILEDSREGAEDELILLFQDQDVIYCTDSGFEQTAEAISWYDERLGSGGKTSGIGDIAGTKYYMSARADSLGAVTGLYLCERNTFFSELRTFLWLTGTSFILNIAVWIFFVRNVIINTVYRPVMDLVNSLERVEKEDYDLIQKEFDEREWDEVTRVFNLLMKKVRENVRAGYEKDLLVKSMELKFLQSQINPHFLYNTLDSIAYKANAGEIVDVNRITGYLSKMYRLIFNKGNDFLKVSSILECCEMYLKICEFKYSTFSYRIRSDESLGEVEALNLIVQTIVENAVVHGFSADKKEFIVLIRTRREGGKLIFEIIDNGKGINEDRLEVFDMLLSAENIKSDSGLANAQKRIHLYYGKDYGIQIKSRQGCYTKVTVTVSIEKPKPIVTQLSEYEDEEEE